MHDLMVMMPLAALKPTTAPATDMGSVGPAASEPAMTVSAQGATVTTAPVTTQQTGAGSIEPPPAKQSPLAQFGPMLLIGGVFVILYLVMMRPQKKAEAARKTLIASMKKGDKVMTIGGLVARVVSMDDDEVVLKIDESANVKAVYKKTSIQQVFDRDDNSK